MDHDKGTIARLRVQVQQQETRYSTAMSEMRELSNAYDAEIAQEQAEYQEMSKQWSATTEENMRLEQELEIQRLESVDL